MSKPNTSRFIAIALAGTMAFSAFATPTFAQAQSQTGPSANPGQIMQVHAGGKPAPQMGGKMNRGRTGQAMLGLTCAPNGAERLEKTLAAVSGAITLSPEQQTLFDTLKTSLLTAQTSYADSCQLPASRDEAKSMSFTDRLAQRQHNLKARVDAMDKVLPDVTAFYQSLTPDQVSQLRGLGAKAMGRDHGRAGDKMKGPRSGAFAGRMGHEQGGRGYGDGGQNCDKR